MAKITRLQVRVSAAELDQLRDRATAAGMTVSELVRLSLRLPDRMDTEQDHD